MKDLVEYIVKSIVNNPEAVEVTEEKVDGEIHLNLIVDPTDMGMVIGKSGQTIKAIRKILTVRAMADNVRVYLQLGEPEGTPEEEPKEEITEDPGQSQNDSKE